MQSFIRDQHEKFMASATPEFRAMLAAGVEMEYSSVRTDDGGMAITATTNNPCGAVQCPGTGKWFVYERRDGP